MEYCELQEAGALLTGRRVGAPTLDMSIDAISLLVGLAGIVAGPWPSFDGRRGGRCETHTRAGSPDSSRSVRRGSSHS